MIRNHPTIALIFLILLILAGLFGLTWANYRFAEQNPGGNDFLVRWIGAHEWLFAGTSPYDASISLTAQETVYGHPANPDKGEDLNHFAYPFTSMIFFGPFGLFDYILARALWTTTIELSLAALVVVSMRLVNWRLPAWRTALLILFALIWYHGARTIILGQIAAIEALLIAAALLLIVKEQDTLAGLMLALATAKPQMLVLILPFIIIWAYSRRRFRVIWGFLGSFAILFIISLLFIPNWPSQMVRQIIEYPSYTHDIDSVVSIVANTLPGISGQLNAGLSVFFWGYLIVEWVLAYRKDERWFLWTALLTLVLTHFMSVRTATTNYVMMFPAFILILKIWEDRWGKVGKGLVAFTLLAALIGLWALFFSTVDGIYEQPVMYLPLPIFSLLGLWWVRWWAIKPPFPAIEE